MAEQNDQRQLAQVFGSLMAAKSSGEDTGQDPQAEYYRQRDKYEKRRMISSIVAPIAGQFLGNLVAAPFREPVQDFLDTQKGRDLYGQWADHQGEKSKLDAMTARMELHDGDGESYFRKLNKERYDTEMQNVLGEKWYQRPAMQAVARDYNAHLDTVATKEHNAYLEAVDYYKLFPDRATLMGNIEKYGPRSSNFGQAVYRKIKRAVSGQSIEDYTDQAILNITGVNSHIFAQKMDDPLISSDDVSMDVPTFRDRMGAARSPVSSQQMLEYIREAQEEYLNTPHGQTQTFINHRIMEDDRSRQEVELNRYEGEGWSNIHERAREMHRDANEGELPTQDQLNQRIREIYNIPLVDIEDKVLNIFDVDENFKAYRDGVTNIVNGQEVRTEGWNEGVFKLLFNNPDSSSEQHVKWRPEETLESNLLRARVTFGPDADNSFEAKKTSMLKRIISIAQDQQSILITNGSIKDLDFFRGPSSELNQTNMVLGLSKRLFRDYTERKDTAVQEGSAWSFWSAVTQKGTDRTLTGNILSEEALTDFMEELKAEEEMEDQDTNDLVTTAPKPFVGPPSPTDNDPPANQPTALISPLAQVNAEDERFIQRELSLEIANEARQMPSMSMGSPEDVDQQIQYFGQFTPEQANIPGTLAFNVLNVPLFRSALEEPVVLPAEGTGEFFIGLEEQGIETDLYLRPVVEAAGGNFLKLVVYDKGLVRQRTPAPSVPYVLGAGTLGKTSPLQERPVEYFPVGMQKAREVLQDFDQIPDEFVANIAVVAAQSYLPLLRELNKLGVPVDEMIPKVMSGAGKYMSLKTGAYKGNNEKEVKINQLKMALEVMTHSLGVPGLDKAGDRPIIHGLFIKSYLEKVGPANEEEATLLSKILGNGKSESLPVRGESFTDKALEAGQSLYRGLQDSLAAVSKVEASDLSQMPLGPGSRTQAQDVIKTGVEVGRSLLERAKDRLDSVFFPGTGSQALRSGIQLRTPEQQERQDRYQGRLSPSQEQGLQDSQVLKDVRDYHYNRLDIENRNQADTYLNRLNDAIILAESSGDFQAKNPVSTATGGYQFVEEAAKTAARRVINSLKNMPGGGRDDSPEWLTDVAEGKVGVIDLTPTRQRILFEGDMFERKGSDALVNKILTGDTDAITSYYYDFHHTKPGSSRQPHTKRNWRRALRDTLETYED